MSYQTNEFLTDGRKREPLLLNPYPKINATDPFFTDIIFLLKEESLTDLSSSGITINDPDSITTSTTAKYGSTSWNFSPKKLNFNITLGDNFTVEGWYYFTSLPTDTNYPRLWSIKNGNGQEWAQGHSNVHFRSIYHAVNNNVSAVLTINTWHHIAFQKEGTVYNTFVDGTKIHADYDRTTPQTSLSNTFGIGYQIGNETNQAQFLLNTFRITNAVRYTATFDPETETFLYSP